YFNPGVYWYLDGEGFHYDHSMGYGHNLSLFTRAAFEAVGGYPAISGPQDAEMDAALRSKVACRGNGPGEEKLKKSEWYYVYRWGVSPSHLSAFTSPERDFYAEFGALPVQPGRFELAPRWSIDYEAETRTILEAIAAETQDTAGAVSRIIEATYGCGTDEVD